MKVNNYTLKKCFMADGGGGLLGFNPQKVDDCELNVANDFTHLLNILNSGLSDFIRATSQSWYAQEAVDFFNNIVKIELNNLYNSCENSSTLISNKIIDAGNRWAEVTKSDWHVGYVQGGSFDFEISMTDIVPMDSLGRIGIVYERFITLSGKLENLKKDSASVFTDMRVHVSDSGFIGGDQQNYIDGLINEISEVLNGTLDRIIEKITEVLNNGKTDYLDAAKINAASFKNGQESF